MILVMKKYIATSRDQAMTREAIPNLFVYTVTVNIKLP
jgi:hypothetical protein